MSVTFFMPQAPVEQVRPYPEDDPEWVDVVPVEPFCELNVSKSNAAAIIGFVAPWADPYCGKWEGDMIHTVRKNTMRLLNIRPARLESDGYTEHNFMEMGRSAEYVQDRLTRLLTILTVATEHGFSVCYG